ncbi:MAG TPA: YihY/virulence factor BrkB family protein [Candidatus Aquilonibacter sp.]|nr:YihY/virulence factor BrkB family protein [Candidatus Aquilonibacter sp.]
MRGSDVVSILKNSYKGWSADEASRLAAALAFYTIFAIAPLFIVIIEIGAALLGGAGHHHVVRDQILNQLRPAIGDNGTKAIANIVQSTFDQRSKGLFATIVGWVLFAVAATGLIVAVENALDTIWGVKPKAGIFWMIVDRIKSIAIIGGAAVLIVAMGFATAWLAVLGSGIFAKIVNALVVLGVVTVLTAAIYIWLPKVRLSWRDVWFGAICSAVLSVIGQYLIGIYLGRAATTSTYGAAGSLVAVLLWLYYSAQIFLFGAEMTKAYAQQFGSYRRAVQAPSKRGTIENRAKKVNA